MEAKDQKIINELFFSFHRTPVSISFQVTCDKEEVMGDYVKLIIVLLSLQDFTTQVSWKIRPPVSLIFQVSKHFFIILLVYVLSIH